MLSRTVRFAFTLLLSLTFFLSALTFAFARDDQRPRSVNSYVGMTWNLSDPGEPLLEMSDESRSDLDLGFIFPFGQFGMHLSESLHYNSQTRRYLLMLLSEQGRRGNFLELRSVGGSNVFSTTSGPKIDLVDRGSLKILNGPNGNQYTFNTDSVGGLRCIRIQDRAGSTIRFTYNSAGLIDGLADDHGRTVSVNYDDNHVAFLVQTWNVSTGWVVKSWNASTSHHASKSTGTNSEDGPRFALTKRMPRDAVTTTYTREMANCDQMLARVFGGPGAVAAANSYEPAHLSGNYPIYRGDLRGDDGIFRPGHLSYAMHLYGSENGTAVTPLYVPAGFTSHSNSPTPTDAAVTFYYPQLGKLKNVTLAVFHVANFQIQNENGRIRIGNIGGPGGSFELYKHSHIEFYRGNTGLPPTSQRQTLRIHPSLVFGIAP